MRSIELIVVPGLSSGAQVVKVDAPANSPFTEYFTVLTVEIEAYPEPKVLLPNELRRLMDRFDNSIQVGNHIGASSAFVRENLNKSNSLRKRK